MTLAEPILALLIASIFASLLVGLLGRRGPGPFSGLLFFLLLLFLAVWAGGIWITPVGPVAWGVSWVTFLVLGLVFSMLLAAAIPPIKPRSLKRHKPSPEETVAAEAAEIAVDFFFWILIFVLLATIVSRYAWGF